MNGKTFFILPSFSNFRMKKKTVFLLFNYEEWRKLNKIQLKNGKEIKTNRKEKFFFIETINLQNWNGVYILIVIALKLNYYKTLEL